MVILPIGSSVMIPIPPSRTYNRLAGEINPYVSYPRSIGYVAKPREPCALLKLPPCVARFLKPTLTNVFKKIYIFTNVAREARPHAHSNFASIGD